MKAVPRVIVGSVGTAEKPVAGDRTDVVSHNEFYSSYYIYIYRYI